MKTIKILSVALTILFSASFAQTTNWKFDQSHTQIKFAVKHLLISEVTGNFKKFDGTVTTNGDDFTTAKISFTAETNSIFTDNEKRDAHLKSDDFFNAEKFPQLKFVGKSMKKAGKNKYKLTGDLTIRDVTKSVTLDIVYNGMTTAWGSTRAGFQLSGTINRFDYNLKWNNLIETGGAVVSNDVKIICDVELIKENQK
ncbi:MAG: polyisoprenoid-binding protein [Ignavibacteriales bacterium]|nr:MAG: polyisoprenoid-binding protein [Ignavibacteriales bacterium]